MMIQWYDEWSVVARAIRKRSAERSARCRSFGRNAPHGHHSAHSAAASPNARARTTRTVRRDCWAPYARRRARGSPYSLVLTCLCLSLCLSLSLSLCLCAYMLRTDVMTRREQAHAVDTAATWCVCVRLTSHAVADPSIDHTALSSALVHQAAQGIPLYTFPASRTCTHIRPPKSLYSVNGAPRRTEGSFRGTIHSMAMRVRCA